MRTGKTSTGVSPRKGRLKWVSRFIELSTWHIPSIIEELLTSVRVVGLLTPPSAVVMRRVVVHAVVRVVAVPVQGAVSVVHSGQCEVLNVRALFCDG